MYFKTHSEPVPDYYQLYLHLLFFVLSTDEQATESILKAQQSYVNLAGLLDLKTTRDAFVTALCKASLPPHYQLLVLNQPGMWDSVRV